MQTTQMTDNGHELNRDSSLTSDKCNVFSNVHELIRQASHKLLMIENLPESMKLVDATEPIASFEAHGDANDGASNMMPETNGKNSFNYKNIRLHQFMIKEDGEYHCSECNFQSPKYKTFYSHCTNFHSLKNGHLNMKQDICYIYRCSSCLFTTFSLRGFKTHCKTKHRKSNYQRLLNYIPLSSPKAEMSYRLYINSISDGRQRKQAMQQLKYFSNKTRKSGGFRRAPLPSLTNISCMMCPFITSYPNDLHQHYEKIHLINGPRRNERDELYHCDKCNYKNISYTKLHQHFTDSHGLSSTTSNNKMDADNEMDSNNEDGVDQASNGHTDNGSEEVISMNDGLNDKRLMKCDRCDFSTTDICRILNHWRTAHNRFYPSFIMKHIYKDFKQNVVEINFPAWMVDAAWMNGWMNDDCTNLVKCPLYVCDICHFSNNLLTNVNNHYANRHVNSSCSLSKLDVVESDKNAKSYTHMLCKQSQVFKCALCPSYSSCFFKNMVTHYKNNHKEEMDGLEHKIRSSTAYRCVKCEDLHDNLHTVLKHYRDDHCDSLTTFSIRSDNGIETYICQFCEEEFVALSRIAEHLEVHRSQHLEDFNRQHVSAYACSRCRRVFRAERFIRHHYTRLHVEWSDTSFTYDDFPLKYFSKDMTKQVSKQRSPSSIEKRMNSVSNGLVASDPEHSPTTVNREETSSSQEFDVSDASPSTNNYTCYICKFHSQSIITMRVHFKRTHRRYLSVKNIKKLQINSETQSTEEMPVIPTEDADSTSNKLSSTCSHQTWIGKSPAVYQKHVRFHHNTKHPYECPHCSKMYICEVVLRMHIRHKHKTAPVSTIKMNINKISYSCTLRNRKSRNPLLYKLHVDQKHSELNPYRCPKCPKMAVCSSIFSLHLQKHHQQNVTEKLLNQCKQVDKPERQKIFRSLRKKSSATTSKSSVNETVHGNDYYHPKSVMTPAGQWKCLYCKVMLPSYATLKKHCRKFHTNSQIAKCKCCDYICKTNVQLSNHSKIHNNFVANQMKQLRLIWKNKRLNGTEKKQSTPISSASSSSEKIHMSVDSGDNESCKDVEMAEEPVATQKFKVQSARKTIKSCSSGIKNRKINELGTMNLEECYDITQSGTFKCKLCEFVATNRCRMTTHMQAYHVKSRTFQCKLCFFNVITFDEMTTHLNNHHKMERNHHLVIEMLMNYGASSDVGKNGRAGKIRRRPYEPQPSLQIYRQDNSSRQLPSYLKDLFDPSKKISSVSTADNPTVVQKQTLQVVRARATRSTSVEKFECRYCDVETCSTYDMERHMMRHEAAMVDSTKIDETALLYANFTSFLKPRL